MKRPLQIALAIALAAGSADVLALGLGTIQVKSRLNEPLVAEIPVVQTSPGEAQGLIVQLASVEDFERVGLSRSRVAMPLDFSLHTVGEQTVIRVTTKEIVREPFLDFLVEANWPNGRLLREYTVLLDPPVMAPARSAQVKTLAPAAPTSDPSPIATQLESKPAANVTVAAPPPPPPPPAAEREPVVSQAPPPAPSPEPQSAPVSTPKPAPAPASTQITASGEFGPVDAGQTLSEIARITRVEDSVSINQMMIALLRHNPDAFYQDNINALKRGAILRIPTTEEVRATAAEQEAAELARAQIDEWRTAASPALISDAAPAAPARTVTEVPATTEPAARHERVALVPPRSGDEGADATSPVASRGRSGADGAQLRGELARVAEDLESKRHEASELRSRLRDMEESNAKSTRMIALQDDQLAQLQAQLEELRAAGVTVDAPVVLAATLTDEQQIAVDTDVDAAEAEAEAEAEAAAEAPAEALAAIDAPEDDDLEGADAFADGDTDIWGSAEVTPFDSADALGEDGSEFADADAIMTDSIAAVAPEAEIMPLGTPAENAADDAAAPAPVVSDSQASSRSMPTTPWYQRPVVLGIGALALLLAALGLRSRRKVQPAKQRRKSVADQFGDDVDVDTVASEEHGDEIAALKTQLVDNPADAGLHLELASIYYSLADREAFITTARDMRAQVDGGSDEWAAVRSMGHELAADEPLFAETDVMDSFAPAASDDFAPDLASAADEDTDSSLDYDALLGDLAVDAPLDAPVDEPAADSLVFDVPDGADDDFGIAPRSENEGVDVPASFLDALGEDQGAGLDFPGVEGVREPAVEEGPLSDGDGLSFDIDEVADITQDDDRGALAFEMETSTDAAELNVVQDDAAGDTALADGLSLEDDLGSLTDLPGVDAGLDDDGGPTGIKLDLAKAYLDMGDPDGAKAMLEEVLGEGNTAQQDEARMLIERIG